MKGIVLNVFVFVACVFAGGIANGLIINYSDAIIPPPVGSNLTTEEGLKAAMAVMEPKHFIMPFLAHAIGTLVGAFFVTLFIKDRKLFRALLVGFLFFLGGAWMVFELPSPLWFDAVDLGLAYIPMAWIGYKLGLRFSK
ncbi:MAG: hypothetical protein RL664_1691 [Bacteroidota bacterium]|jgi:hypothetical protein